MAHARTDPLLRFLRGLATIMPDGQACDRELLSRFVTQRDEAAFAVLVRRYSSMVLRVVPVAASFTTRFHDAEDVLATFLIACRALSRIHPLA